MVHEATKLNIKSMSCQCNRREAASSTYLHRSNQVIWYELGGKPTFQWWYAQATAQRWWRWSRSVRFRWLSMTEWKTSFCGNQEARSSPIPSDSLQVISHVIYMSSVLCEDHEYDGWSIDKSINRLPGLYFSRNLHKSVETSVHIS